MFNKNVQYIIYYFYKILSNYYSIILLFKSSSIFFNPLVISLKELIITDCSISSHILETALIKVCLSIDLVYPLDVVLLLLAIHSSQKILNLPLNILLTPKSKGCKYLVEFAGKKNTCVSFGEIYHE